METASKRAITAASVAANVRSAVAAFPHTALQQAQEKKTVLPLLVEDPGTIRRASNGLAMDVM